VNETILSLSDWLLTFVHVFFIAFLLSGWAFRRLRTVHAAALAITLVSWFFLGAFFGWGYCFLTDWHWEIRAERGLAMPNSFIKFLIDSSLGTDLAPDTTDALAVGGLLLAVLAAVVVRILDRKRRRRIVLADDS